MKAEQQSEGTLTVPKRVKDVPTRTSQTIEKKMNEKKVHSGSGKTLVSRAGHPTSATDATYGE
jgi:hypothetical protein